MATVQTNPKPCLLLPYPGRIIVEIDTFTYGGTLYIPENARRLPTTGVVVAVGQGVTSPELGHRVCFPLYSGTLVKFKNMPKYRILTPEEILCQVPNDHDLDLEDMGT